MGQQEGRMGQQEARIGRQEAKKLSSCSTFVQIFHILTVSLLSLLLPLSFLLLARLSSYNYLLTLTFDRTLPPPSFFSSLLLRVNPAILSAIVSIVSVGTLFHGLTGKTTLPSESPAATCRPRLYIAWVILCTLQIIVGLGIKGSVAAGIDGIRFDPKRNFLSRVIFFLGLHDIMLQWSRAVVKPVVDDAIFGVPMNERWVQRVATALCFGTLWWWRLRDEVDSLVIVVEAKKEILMGVGAVDLVGWWLYYLTVTIGMVRVVKGLIWAGVVLLCRRISRSSDEPHGNESNV